MLLASLPQDRDPNLLVGFDSSDDAGVYRLTDEIALVVTADFITPPVDDPFIFGQVAAANAISDVYAMGGRPVTCLNLVCFPPKKLEGRVLERIVAGALTKIVEAGAVLAGGHTVDDDEPKFGLAVTGVVHPLKYWPNSGARMGDALILTKPVGSGVLFNANIKKWVSPAAMDGCLQSLVTLNKAAAEVLAGFEVHGATDVTGFGLAGHGYEVAKASGVCLEIDLDRVPIMAEALDVYQRGMSTGVNKANRELVGNRIQFDDRRPAWHREIVFDPQTNGGLLVSLPADQAEAAVAGLRDAGVAAARCIGRVTESRDALRLVIR